MINPTLAQTNMKIKILDKHSIIGWYELEGIHIRDIRQEGHITIIEVRYRRPSVPHISQYRLFVDLHIDPDGQVRIYLPFHNLRHRVIPPPEVMRAPLSLLTWCRDWIWNQLPHMIWQHQNPVYNP